MSNVKCQIRQNKIMDAQKQSLPKNQDITVTFKDKYQPNTKTLSIMKRKSADQCVWISFGSWEQFGLRETCENVDIWDLNSGLGLSGNYNPRIIKELCGVNFTMLKVLILNYNCLYSLQWVHKLHCPELKCLDLSENEIWCIRGMRKGHFQKLKRLDMGLNKINNEIQDLVEMKNTGLQQLNVSQNGQNFLNYFMRFRQTIKLESRKLKVFGHKGNSLLEEQYIKISIQLKCPTVKYNWSLAACLQSL